VLDKFWESIGSNLAERWLEYIFGPAFLFWAGGVGLYVWKTGWSTVLAGMQVLTPLQQGIWIILALLVLVFSSMLMHAIHFPLLRLLEGYWPLPFNFLRLGVVAIRKLFFQPKYDDLRSLKALDGKGKLDSRQSDKLSRLEVWAHWHPVSAEDQMPTALGNILRARELGPGRKYGLDAVVCWPRLWPLLSENVRNDLMATRSSLDRLVELWFWGLLFLLWTSLTPWAIVIGLLWMILAYGTALQAAMAYGELLESAFDLHRLSLYDAVGWPRPKNNDEEKVLGEQLTEFLWRGGVSGTITYQFKEKE
jgi:hypothetical protein